MCNSSPRAARRKFGRYLPYQRANVDEVPLPFVNDMDTTYEQKGAKRVAINDMCIDMYMCMCMRNMCMCMRMHMHMYMCVCAHDTCTYHICIYIYMCLHMCMLCM